MIARLGRLAVVAGLALIGCTSETGTPPDRSSSSSGGGTTDTPDAGAPDPNNGRDSNAASCFASCSNTSFSCQAKASGTVTITTGELAVSPTGCEGTLTNPNAKGGPEVLQLKLDCPGKKVCVGTAPGQSASDCQAGTFSATSFAYTSGSITTVCTRS